MGKYLVRGCSDGIFRSSDRSKTWQQHPSSYRELWLQLVCFGQRDLCHTQ
ncbi:hypothetical protein ACS5NO_21140 [Larkinella sp. GY13]